MKQFKQKITQKITLLFTWMVCFVILLQSFQIITKNNKSSVFIPKVNAVSVLLDNFNTQNLIAINWLEKCFNEATVKPACESENEEESNKNEKETEEFLNNTSLFDALLGAKGVSKLSMFAFHKLEMPFLFKSLPPPKLSV